MQIFYDGIIAFLCCAGIVMVVITFYRPKKKPCTRVAGVIISDDAEDVLNWSGVLKNYFNQVIVVTRADFSGIMIKNVLILSPEEYKEYVTGKDYN